MSRSRSGKPDPDQVNRIQFQRGWSCFSTRKVDQLVLAPKWRCLLNGVDPSCMNSINGSTCRAKCSNILHDNFQILGEFLFNVLVTLQPREVSMFFQPFAPFQATAESDLSIYRVFTPVLFIKLSEVKGFTSFVQICINLWL